ncbi:hypothetical protein BCR42DRAFT_493717 [Absidia repens]|uniref:MYND-type domain-containing protein n=1 Tax=Absidia repens TaxID=90262 RepID=A0A1X2I9T2_9FUNG|nr:hypothetical protein BCR42DRAFT_493717 [Absidia repens]
MSILFILTSAIFLCWNNNSSSPDCYFYTFDNMREPNLCFPSHNKAAVCITSALYDRRALDCTASLPLINSLTHLAYLTSTSPRIREILVLDGGLEQLVRILSPQHLEPERRSLWKWSLAFQCVVNVGVRGTEQIRTKVVDAGMIPIVLRVLENFLRALELVRQESDRQDNKNGIRSSSATSTIQSSSTHNDYSNHQEVLGGLISHSRTAEQTLLDSHQLVNTTRLPSTATTPAAATTATSTTAFPPVVSLPSSSSNNHNLIPNTETKNNTNTSPGQSRSPRQQHRVLRKSTFPYIKMNAAQRRKNRMNRESIKSVPTWQDPRVPNIDNVFYREEDILLSLQLLAYLSKYPHIRNQFHTNYDRNVFSVVERFCHRLHPNPIQYWAGVIMRNACRKDETKGGTRRCANMHCGKWESQPREFAKCRRCRKAKYCCKACQSKAWADGHRWWCVERHATVPPPQDASSSTIQQQVPSTTTTVTATPAPVGAGTTHQLRPESTTPTPTAVTASHSQEQHRQNTATMSTMTSVNPTTSSNTSTMATDIHPRSQTAAARNNQHQQTIADNNITDPQHRLPLGQSLDSRRHHHHILSSPTSTVPTMNARELERRPSSLSQQQQQHQQLRQQDQPSSGLHINEISPSSSSPHGGDLAILEQNLDGGHTQNDSTESSDDHNAILMDVGLQMEL